MPPPPLDVCILWHMHQPLYEDPATGRGAMPWVRLHALKDYYDMVTLVRGHPGVQVTFNLVPVLIEQLDAAADGTKPDRWLELARRKPEELQESDQVFLLDSFFAVNHEKAFSSLPRYGELHRQAFGESGPSGWTPADWRDLQTLFHLSWCGETLRAEPLVRRLRSKGRSYTEEEKQSLLDLQQEFLKKVIPAYIAARDEGLIELTASPTYHPILPLLCDLASVREASPGTPLPACPPRAREDAMEQVVSGIDAFTNRLGERPAGIWPPEGALSDETLDLLESAGAAWTATDQELLAASLRQAGMEGRHPIPPLAPFRFGSRKIAVFFRDHVLSDLIGFTYASWSAPAASADFLERLRGIAGRRATDQRGAVAVILDGENAWESYHRNGADFLDSLYGALEHAEDLRAVTFSHHLRDDPEIGYLPRLSAGSWIRGDLNTWIGHPEKNRAWELLCAARAAWMETGERAEARRWLRAAQGSDWFWWFGDDHSSSMDSAFDLLFRSYLRKVFEATGRDAPAELASPIKRHPGKRRVLDPTAPVTPIVDGRVTDYFEWLGAGSLLSEPASTAMHAAGGGVRSLHFGADTVALALRMDPIQPPFSETVGAAGIELAVRAPRARKLRVSVGPAHAQASPGGSPGGLVHAAMEIACGRILEARIPLAVLGLAPGERVEFSLTLLDMKGNPIATFPPEGALALTLPSPGAATDDWSV